MRATMITKKYPKSLSGWIEKSIGIWWMEKRGYMVYTVEEESSYSGGKGCALAIIFLPLALLGGRKYWKITFLDSNVGEPRMMGKM